jgi:tetratricopeptide (TPR) repeat protein
MRGRKIPLPAIPVIVLVVALGGWFIYTEFSREPPQEHVHTQDTEAGTHSEAHEEIDRLQRQVDQDPNDSGTLLRLANLLHDHSLSSDPGMLPRAIRTYQAYLEKNPSDGNARVDLGICYFELSRADTTDPAGLIHRAVEEMKTVYDANPKHQAAAFNLGIVTLSSGQTIASNDWFRRAVDIDPGSTLGKRAQSILEQHTFAAPTE